MTGVKSNTTLLCLVLLLGFGGIWELQHAIDARRASLHQEEDDVVLRSGPLLKVMSLEYAPLMADLYWTRVVQYYGDKHAHDDANIQLSQRRAESVADYLVKAGIPPERLNAVGYGKTRPIASNDTEEGRAQNRRIEFDVK